MQKLWRGFLVLLLILLATNFVTASEGDSTDFSSKNGFIQQEESATANIRMIPSEGTVGDNFTILLSGLLPNESVTVRIIFEDDNRQVYSSTRNANDRGRLEIDIFTETSDPAGTYRVELLNASEDVIGTASFTLTELGGREGIITISPLEGEAGTNFTIELTEVQAFADLSIEVTDEDGTEVYSTRLRATVDGTATIHFESSADAVGELTVTAYQSSTIEVASGSFTVLEQIFPATIILEPAEAMPTDEVFVTISGLEPESTVTVLVSGAGIILVNQEETANVSGLIIFSFVLAEDTTLEEYRVEVRDGETLLSAAELVVDIPAPTVTISPEIGVPSSNFLVEVAGIRSNEAIVVEISAGEEVLQSLTLHGDDEGNGRAILGQRLNLEVGNYTIQVYRRGVEVYQQSVEIVAQREAPETSGINPEDVTVTVSPESGLIPTEYTITVEGLPANTDLRLSIIFDGRAVFTTQGTSDENGILVTSVSSEPSDPVGTYTLEVRAEGEVIGTTDFAILDEEAQTEPETEVEVETSTGEIAIQVAPTVRQGERFEVFVTGLNASESVTIELRLEGETVYSSVRSADSNGAFGIALVTSDDDIKGSYEIVVLRGEESLATAEFELISADAVLSDARLSITPETAPLGNTYVVTVSGLAAEENVRLSVVSAAGEQVYTAERQANAQGTVTFVLNSEADDELGDYAVVVQTNEGQLTGSFTITEGQAEPETSELSMSIAPESGELGTDHDITVTGLAANEAVTLHIEFEGAEVYTAAGQANSDGVYQTTLTTEDTDPTGTYTIIVESSTGTTVSGVLIAGEESSANTSAISITIDPSEVTATEIFEVQITGLDANETVTVNVLFDDESVYETNRTANASGEVTLNLTASEADPIGTYTVTVARENGETASDTVEVLGETTSTQTSDISITVAPESGERGTNHEFSITGLDANENISIIVEFDGAEVYSTERQADANGAYTLNLASDESDGLGDYTLTVTRDNGETASVIFSVVGDEAIVEPPQVNEDVIVLADDLPVFTGRLTEEEPQIAFTLYGEEGQGIQLDLSSEQFDTYLQLLDEDGNELASDDDTGDGLNSRISMNLPYTGEYTIIATSFSNTIGGDAGIGRFDLSILLIELENTIVQLGTGSQFITGNLSELRPEIRYVFEGEEGTTILISQTSNDFDSYLTLLDENGNILDSNDDSNGTLNSQIGPFELPYSGEYTAVVSSYGYVNYTEARIGNFEFRLETVSVTETSYGQALNLELTTSAASQFIEFDGSAGDVISVRVDSGQTVDTTLTVLDPTGYALMSDDDGGLGYDPEIARLVLPQDGTYTILLQAFTAGDTGEVEILVNLEDVRTLDEESRMVRLNSKQSNDILIFEGQAGEVISLNISLESGTIGSYSISAEQDGYSIMTYQSSGMPNTITLGFQVPSNGTVRITFNDNSASTVILNVSIERE